MLRFKKFLIENKSIISFPIELLKSNKGEIGRQGLSAETISGILNDVAGIDNKNFNVMQSLEIFKDNKDAQNKFLSFIEKNPISVTEMPNNEGFHLNDGHHRAYLMDYIGEKTIPTKLKDVAGKVATTLIDPTQPVVDATVAQVTKAAPKLGKTDILPASRSRIPGPRPAGTSIGYGLAGLAGGLAGEYLVEPAAEKAGVFNAVERGTRAALSKMPDWAADVADKGFGAAQVALDPLSAMAPMLQQGFETKIKQEVDAAIKAGKPSQVRVRGPKF